MRRLLPARLTLDERDVSLGDLSPHDGLRAPALTLGEEESPIVANRQHALESSLTEACSSRNPPTYNRSQQKDGKWYGARSCVLLGW